MDNLRFIFLDLLTNKKQYVISSSITFLLMLICLFVYSVINKNYINNLETYYPKNTAYIEYQVPQQSKDIQVYKSPSLSQIDSTNSYSISEKVIVSDLKPIKETSQALLNDIVLTIEDTKELYSYNYINNYFPKVINSVYTSNPSYGIKKIITGQYPYAENELLLPESLALYYVNVNNYSTYEQLLNTNITFNKKVYKVVGIYQFDQSMENENIIGYNSDIPQSKLTSSFIVSNNKDKIKELVNKYSSTISYYDNKTNYSTLFILNSFIILMIVFYYFILETLKKSFNKLNHYNKSLINYVIYLVSFILYILLFCLAYVTLYFTSFI
ncbi:MAG: hypothetical protein ACK5HS_03750 [Mycoplasmatales bacterium]